MNSKSYSVMLVLLFAGIISGNSITGQSTGVITTRERQEQKREQERITARDNYRIAYSYGVGFDEGSSHLTLSKQYDGESVSKSGNFKIEKNINMLKISVEGQVKEGSITITLKKPDNIVFKELEIDSSADIQWQQVFTIREEGNEYSGEWTYQINAQNATGRYSMSITTH